jgi:flavin reductase (DIM6/NTAB) family NADH-FMN oxidoreductase RutF
VGDSAGLASPSPFKAVERPLRMLRPVPVYLLLSGSLEAGDVNVMAASWVVPTSKRPPRIGVVIDKSAYTLSLVRRYGWLVLAVVGPDMAELVKYVGTHSRREVDKVAVTGLRLEGWERDPRVPIPTDSLGWIVLERLAEVDLGPTVLVNTRVLDARARGEAYEDHRGWRSRVLLHKAKHSFDVPCGEEIVVVKTRWGVAVKKPWRNLWED